MAKYSRSRAGTMVYRIRDFSMTWGQVVILLFPFIVPIVFLIGCAYGDYQSGERYMVFWKKKKKDVNSGAKFG